jgi:hypothetical protein
MEADDVVVSRLKRAGSLVLVAGVISVVGAACSSSDDSSSSKGSDDTTAKAPEDVFADDATVTAGIGAMRELFAQAAAAVDSGADASSFPDSIEGRWSKIEGTFKKNEPKLYLQVEDAMSTLDQAIEAKDGAKAQDAADSFSSAADSYLASHP